MAFLEWLCPWVRALMFTQATASPVSRLSALCPCKWSSCLRACCHAPCHDGTMSTSNVFCYKMPWSLHSYGIVTQTAAKRTQLFFSGMEGGRGGQ